MSSFPLKHAKPARKIIINRLVAHICIVAVVLVSVGFADAPKTLGPAGTTVRWYLELDARGARLGTRDFTGALLDPRGPSIEELRGESELVIISKFSAFDERYSGDRATVRVKYEVIGETCFYEGECLKNTPERIPSEVTFTFELRASDDVWRIWKSPTRSYVWLETVQEGYPRDELVIRANSVERPVAPPQK